MPRTHRIDDCNNGGGCVTTTPQSTVYANNRLVVVNGSRGTGHSPCEAPDPPHCENVWTTENGGPTVFAENIPINKEGDTDSCGHYRKDGSNLEPLTISPYPVDTYNVYNDAFVGAGVFYDNTPPLDPADIYVSLPSGEVVTELDVYVYDNNDVPEEINPGPASSNDAKPVTSQEEDPTQPAPNVPPTQDCSVIDSLPASFVYTSQNPDFDTWAAGFSLSPNYTVFDLTVGPAASTYRFTTSATQASGLTQKEILQNLCFLAKTVLEPMRTRYSNDFTITSGFRNKSGGSQHNKGQAADVQIFGFHGGSGTGQSYYNRAQDVRDNIDYDQMILEWFGRNPWIHVSSNSSGHRKSVLTQVSSSSYDPGLKRLG